MRRRALIAKIAGAAALPLAARAQQKAMPVIGYLSGGSPDPDASGLAPFRQGLRESGYVEGQNLTIEYRWAEDRTDRLPALAAELVGRKVDVIVTRADAATLAAKAATSTISIVFVIGSDPVEYGFVASLARPGGNLTGVGILVVELNAKRLELLRELLPQRGVIALLVTQATPERVIADMQVAARMKGVQVHILKASSDSEMDVAFAAIVQRQAGAVVVAASPFFTNRRERLVALAARHAVPVIYPLRDFTAAGGLISYGPSPDAYWRDAGIYAGRILKGAKPADLPVAQPTKFELVINMRTAMALGLAVPLSILARADEVIE